jgi:restriction system protein
VSLVREFYGVMVSEKAARGIFVTTGIFTPEAITFARGKPLELVDGPALARLVEDVRTLKPAATPVAEPATPSCPKCGEEMVKRVAKRGANAGNAFWGCRRYPQCKGTLAA